MKTRFIRSVAMLLAVVMIVGLIPMIYAAETPMAGGSDETVPAETIEESSEAAGESEPDAGETQPSQEPTQAEAETSPSESQPAETNDSQDENLAPSDEETQPPIQNEYEDVSAVLKPFTDNAVVPYAAANCQQAQLAIFWVNNQERNPYGEMDDYVYFEFPAGQKKSTGKMALYTVKIGGSWRTAYCIEPGFQEADYYNTEQMTMDEWIASQIKSGHLTEAQMRAIGVVMLYGQTERPGSRDYQGLARMMATQVLVWEIAIGDRDPYPPYVRRNDTHIRRLTDGPYGVEITSLFLNIPQGTRIRGVVDEYNKIAAKLEQHYVIPSFTSLRQSQAPSIKLQPKGNGTYSATVTDTNGILDKFTFQNTGNLSFSRRGNSLTITANGPVPDTVIAATKSVPSAQNQVYYVMHNGGYQRMVASVSKPKNDPLPAYFKVTMPNGNLDIKKTTEDGKNLAGWKFGIYSDQSCSKLVSGPHVSDGAGNIHAEGLNAGTFWVKELGHTNSSVNAAYVCDSPNPQKVTVQSGKTATVSFYNRLRRGDVEIRKQTNTGTDLGGWKIGLYYDSACKKPVSGSPFKTASDGTITVPGLLPGTYYAREVDESAQYPYWVFDKSTKTVVVKQDQTATVTFENTQLGDLKVKKNAINGSAAGWNFQILDSGKNLVETIQTGPDGYAYSSKLQPGTYYVREIHDRDDTYWEYDAEVEKQVTVVAGAQATVTYTNTQYGRIEFHKTTNTMNHLAGWTFEVRNADKELVGRYVTDETGYACTEKLAPGRYFVKEVTSDDPYWSCDVTDHTVDVTAGKTVGDSWTNIEQGKGIFHKTTNTGENLQGWELTVYADAKCKTPIATVVTGEDGSTELFLEPGTYYVRETGDRNNRFDDPYWKLDESVKTLEIRAHEDTEVTFSNTHFGKIRIIKTMSTDGSVEGWQFRITDADGNEVEGSPFTSGPDGLILSGNLLPGTYTVEELIPKDSLFYCKSENPQTIHVVQGTTAEVTFQNALRPGKISVLKVDLENRPLAGAEFLLEWSKDGKTWAPITYSDLPDVTLGTCNNPLVKEGCLVSGEDGLIEWGNLYPGIYYRITEVAAPEGYTLLTDYAFNGQLPIEDLTVTLRVVNTRTFELPKTGSMSLSSMPLKLGLCAAIFMGAVCSIRKKED